MESKHAEETQDSWDKSGAGTQTSTKRQMVKASVPTILTFTMHESWFVNFKKRFPLPDPVLVVFPPELKKEWEDYRLEQDVHTDETSLLWIQFAL